MLLYPEREQLLVVTNSATLAVLSRDDQLQTWDTLASEKDNVVRMYNFETEDNYVIPVEADTGLVTRVVALTYDERYGLLGCGTADGRV